MQKRAVLSGYATLDHVMTTAASEVDAGTTPVRIVAGAWPRAAGAALYAARRLAAYGHLAHPLVAIGSDAGGEAYLRACRSAGVATDGITVQHGGRSPTCVLLYHHDGRYTCLLDGGTPPPDTLSVGQATLVAKADLVAIAAGPPAATAAILAHVRPAQTVAWIVKDDPACFPESLRHALTARADFIFYNAAERALVDLAGPASCRKQWRIETHGANGVVLQDGQTSVHLPVARVETEDPTGAGDTLAGSVLAQTLSGKADVAAAVAQAMTEVRDMLSNREASPEA
jgi:ribokinase